MPKNLKYPESGEAARLLETSLEATEGYQWLLGDMLIKECGAPSANGVNDGSTKKLVEAAAEMKASGRKIPEGTLREFRLISHLYPPASRLAGVSWTVHQAVRSPAHLTEVVNGWDNNETLTVERATALLARHLEDLLQEQRNKQAAEAAAEIAKAKQQADEAAEAVRQAASLAERRAAEQKQTDAKQAVKTAVKKQEKSHLIDRNTREAIIKTPPRAEQIPGLALASQMIVNAGKASLLARQTLDIVKARGDEMQQVSVDAAVEKALEAHKAWLDVANELRKNRANKRSHLAVVGQN